MKKGSTLYKMGRVKNQQKSKQTNCLYVIIIDNNSCIRRKLLYSEHSARSNEFVSNNKETHK